MALLNFDKVVEIPKRETLEGLHEATVSYRPVPNENGGYYEFIFKLENGKTYTNNIFPSTLDGELDEDSGLFKTKEEGAKGSQLNYLLNAVLIQHKLDGSKLTINDIIESVSVNPIGIELVWNSQYNTYNVNYKRLEKDTEEDYAE